MLHGGQWYTLNMASAMNNLVYTADYRPGTHRLSTTPKYQVCMLRIVFWAVGRVDPAWPHPAMWASCTILTVTYTMNMIIALTAYRDREAKVWRPKSMVYFFPCSIQPGTTQKVHKFLTLTIKQMHHPTRALRAHTPRAHCAIYRSTFVCMAIILWTLEN